MKNFQVNRLVLAMGFALLGSVLIATPSHSEETRNFLYVTGTSTDVSRTGVATGSASGFNLANTGAIAIGSEVAVTRQSAHFLDSNGNLWGWGSDGREVGTGSTASVSSPTLINISEKVIQLASGENHTLALTSNGNIYSWGWNGHGQLGTGGSEDYSTSWIYSRPTLISLPGGIKAKYISAGGYQSYAIGSDNSIWGWGINGTYYELGTGGYASVYSPTLVRIPGGFVPIKLVTDGGTHHLVLGQDGSVIGWGHNGNSGLGVTGVISAPTLVANSTNQVIDIATNGAATYLVTSKGKVFSAGYNGYGQLGNTNVYDKTSQFTLVALPSTFLAVKVFANSSNAWATDQMGRTYAWGAGSNDALGTGYSGTVNIPQEMKTFGKYGAVSIAGNYQATFAIVTNSYSIAAEAKAAADKAAAEAKAAADKAAAEAKAAADKAAAEAKAAADKAAAEAKAAADKAAAEAKAAADKAAAEAKAIEAADKAKKSKEKTIVCVKGKSSLKVIGKYPKCPSGYKIKK